MADTKKLIIEIDVAAKGMNPEQLQQALFNLRKERNELAKLTKKDSELSAENAAKLNELTQKTAIFNTELKNKLKIQQQEAGAVSKNLGYYQQQSVLLSQLTAKYKGLNEAQLKGAEGKNLASQIQKINSELKTFDSNLGNNQRKVGSYADAIGTSFASIAKYAVGAFSVYAIADFGKQVFDATAKAESFNIAMTTMLQSKEKADLLIKDLTIFAQNTPFELTEIKDTTKRLIAFGVETKNIIPTLTKLGDVSAGLSQPLGEMAYLFGTIKTQGRAMTVDINQFANRGVPIWEELAKITGKNGMELRKYVEAGKIGFTEIEQVFTNLTATGGKFNNLMAAQSKSLSGQVSNLKDKYDALLVSIGNSNKGLFQGIIDSANIGLNQLKLLQLAGEGQISWLTALAANSETNFKKIFDSIKTAQEKASEELTILLSKSLDTQKGQITALKTELSVYRQWIKDNAAKKGTEEYAENVKAFDKLKLLLIGYEEETFKIKKKSEEEKAKLAGATTGVGETKEQKEKRLANEAFLLENRKLAAQLLTDEIAKNQELEKIAKIEEKKKTDFIAASAKAREDRIKLIEAKFQQEREKIILDNVKNEQKLIDEAKANQKLRSASTDDIDSLIAQRESFLNDYLKPSIQQEFDLKIAAIKAISDAEIATETEKADAIKQIELAKNQYVLSLANSAFSDLKGLASENTIFFKTMALAQIAADTATAITGAMTNSELNPANAVTGGLAGVIQMVAAYARIIATAAQAKQYLNFWDGGYTGDGGKYEPAGVVHKGEYVVKKEIVQRNPQLIGNLEYMRKGYYNGGLAGGGNLTNSFINSKFAGRNQQQNLFVDVNDINYQQGIKIKVVDKSVI